jgi:hypothetical protein
MHVTVYPYSLSFLSITAPNTHSQLMTAGELHQIVDGEYATLTTNQGVPISDNGIEKSSLERICEYHPMIGNL